MRPERVALLSCETRVPETKTQSVLDLWTAGRDSLVGPMSCRGCGLCPSEVG